MSFRKEEFEKNIGKDGMQHYDNDLKFMGAHEICKMVTNGELTADKPEMNRYIDGLFLHLKPDNTSEVKGNAVTCISRICAKLEAQQIEKVVKELIEKITSTNKEIEDIRDIFVLCIKNIIQEVPHDFHDKLEIIIHETSKGIRSARQRRQSKAEQELIEILTLMFKRWGTIYKDNKFQDLISLLKENVISNNVEENLRKKSCVSIGAIAVMHSSQEICQIVDQLLTEHKKIGDKSKQEQSKLRAICQTLNSLSKTVPQKMESRVAQLFNLLKNEFQYWGLQEDPDDIDFVPIVCELYECYLSIIENLIKGCDQGAFTKEQKKDLINVSVELMTMDPDQLCTIEEQDQDMEEEDDEDSDDCLDSDYDQDDSSWRVRRSAMLVIEQIILTDKLLIDDIYHTTINPKSQVDVRKNIVRRLKEKNESVRSTIIQVLTSFISQVMVKDYKDNSAQQDVDDFDLTDNMALELTRTYSKMTDFNLHHVIVPIIYEVGLINQDKKSKNQIKLQSYRLVEDLSNTVGRQIAEYFTTWECVFKLLFDTLQDNKAITDLKVSSLISLNRILKQRFNRDAKLQHLNNDLVQLLYLTKQSLIRNENYRIQAESLRLVSYIFRLIRKYLQSETPKFSQNIQALLPDILQLLEQPDVDQEIKSSVIMVARGLIIHVPDQVNDQQLSVIFKALHTKCQTEHKNRISILKLYRRIPSEISEKLQTVAVEYLNATTDTLCDYLKREDRSERIATLQAINRLVTILQNKISPGNQQRIIEGSLHMVQPKYEKEIDPSQAILALQIYKLIIGISPKPTPQYQKISEGCLYLTRSPIFCNTTSRILYEVFSILAQHNIIDVNKTINIILDSITPETIVSSATAIASLASVTKNQSIIINIATQFALKQVPEDLLLKRQVALQILCEYGKVQNLTGEKTIFEGVLNLINNPNEDLDKVRKYASIALGGIAIQNLEFTLPKVIEFINQGKNAYLMLNTLKEIIQNSEVIQAHALQSISQFIFSQAGAKQDGSQQDLKSIISICIGKLCIHNYSALKQQIVDGLKSQNENVKFCTASSFKYFFINGVSIPSTELHFLVSELINIADDKSIQVREAVLRSLNTIAFNLPLIMEEHFNQNLFNKLVCSLQYYNIVITDLGAFKDKRDKGAPLRTSAFQLLQQGAKFKHFHELYEQTIKVCREKMADEIEQELKLIRTEIQIAIVKTQPNKLNPFVDGSKNYTIDAIKAYANNQPIPDNAIELVNACCLLLHLIDVSPQINKTADFTTFLSKLKTQNNNKFGKIFDGF